MANPAAREFLGLGAPTGHLSSVLRQPRVLEAVSAALAELVAADHAVRCRWISEAELDANPELVRTMSVQPPRGRGAIRLLEIEGIDLQPCGGTHLRSTSEVGAVRIGKVEKKGRHNRRVNLHLDD